MMPNNSEQINSVIFAWSNSDYSKSVLEAIKSTQFDFDSKKYEI